jgi:hypothetical protein
MVPLIGFSVLFYAPILGSADFICYPINIVTSPVEFLANPVPR